MRELGLRAAPDVWPRAPRSAAVARPAALTRPARRSVDGRAILRGLRTALFAVGGVNAAMAASTGIHQETFLINVHPFGLAVGPAWTAATTESTQRGTLTASNGPSE
jgi:hypothetical protein